MARLRQCGFELNSKATDVELDGATSGSQLALESSIVRSGAYSIHGNTNGANAAQFTFDLGITGVGKDVLYVRFYVRIARRPAAQATVFAFTSEGDHGITIAMNTSGALLLYDESNGATIGSASSVLDLDTWYMVEVFQDITTPSSTTATARLNASQFASGTANLTGLHGADIIRFGQSTSSNFEWYIDDIAINDNSGSLQNSWPGFGKIIHLKPNATGDTNSFATQTGGTAGASNNFTRVNEVTPDDATTFNGSNTLNEEDLFNCDNSNISLNSTINVVAVGVRFRNNTADATTAIKLEIEKTASGTISQSSAIVPNSTTWKTNAIDVPFDYPLVLYKDPDNIDWTQATLDTMQVGYKITTGGTNRIEVSTLWASIDYNEYNIGGTMELLGV
jgi:hypothetical protein